MYVLAYIALNGWLLFTERMNPQVALVIFVGFLLVRFVLALASRRARYSKHVAPHLDAYYRQHGATELGARFLARLEHQGRVQIDPRRISMSLNSGDYAGAAELIGVQVALLAAKGAFGWAKQKLEDRKKPKEQLDLEEVIRAGLATIEDATANAMVSCFLAGLVMAFIQAYLLIFR